MRTPELLLEITIKHFLVFKTIQQCVHHTFCALKLALQSCVRGRDRSDGEISVTNNQGGPVSIAGVTRLSSADS